MKKIFSLLILIFLFFFAEADHFAGYDLCLINVKNSNGGPTYNYKWRLKLYRNDYGMILPNSVSFKLYANNSNTVISTFSVVKTNQQTFLSFPESDCYPQSANYTTEVGIYESASIDYSGLTNMSNYYVMQTDCCRDGGITNLFQPSGTGYTYTIDFPRLSSTSNVKFNSSPEFKSHPSFQYKVGRYYRMDWSAFDLDGDSLVYKIIKPFSSDYNGKPFETVDYTNGYKLDSNIADGDPDFSINSQTGEVSYLPTKIGYFVVSVKVDEYRNIAGVPTKIGTIYRDIQLRTIIENNPPPTLADHKNRSQVIIDTVDYNNEYELILNGQDVLGDSLYLSAIPSIAPGENLFDPLINGAKFGYWGSPQGGQAGQDLVLKGDSLVSGKFLWKPKCEHARDKPYKISFVLRDRNCPDANDDSLHVFIYVNKKTNNPPMFISPDTISTHKVLKYYLNEGQHFSLSGDSILKTYDKDSTQVVNIICIKDPNNEGFVNGTSMFSAYPAPINATAEFHLQVGCFTIKPHRFTFLAFDNSCYDRDTVSLTIELYVMPKQLVKESICGVAVDTFFSPYNFIYWNKTNLNANAYLVYKQNKLTLDYEYIGNTLDTGFADMNVNPSVQNESYKIIAVDICGTQSVISDGVKSLLLSSSYLGVDGVQLNWEGYAGASVDSFVVWKRINNAEYLKIAKLSNSIFTYVDSNYLIADKTSYLVELDNSTKCSLFRVGRREGMISNQTHILMNGMYSNKPITYYIIPNPSSNQISISGLPENKYIDLIIYDIQGKEVLTKKYLNGEKLDISILNKGVYSIKINGIVQKFVKI